MNPQPNVSVKHSEDDSISHQDGIPIPTSCVETSDNLLYAQSCCSVQNVVAVDRNKQANYSSKRV